MPGNKGTHMLLVMAAFLGVLGSFAFWLEIHTRQEERALAMSTARAIFDQNLVIGKWNSRYGGVYVPVTSGTPLNPGLPEHLPVLTADNGMVLTKINPGHMFRQLEEMAAKDGRGIRFHLTSLDPIRPENKAADWEEKWLHSFEHGAMEQGEFFHDGRASRFRYMAPLFVSAVCLECHMQRGYKEGDVLGGLSISLPYNALSHLPNFAGFGSAAVIGLVVIFLGSTIYVRKQRLLDALLDSPLPTCVTDKEHTILMANEAYWTMFGPTPDHQKTIKCHEHRAGKSCHTPNCPLARITGGAGTYACESIKEKDGIAQHFIATAKPLLNAKGKVIGIVENFQEITRRKQAEMALEEYNRKLEALSMVDGLTGVANRRRFDEILAREYARHARSGGALSLIMLDIDHFKRFNDCYGRVDGDECLRQIARAMAGCLARPTDLAARYGGEEFACILPETDSSGAVAIAEKIRLSIIARAIPHKESKTADYVTASLGVTTVQGTFCGSAMDMVAQADELLYLAKSAGRNRVKFVAPDKAGEKPQGIQYC